MGLDMRMASHAPRFSGDRASFEGWSFAFESFTEIAGWGELIARAVASDVVVDNDVLTDEQAAISRQLFHVLAGATAGHAQTLLRLVPRGHGFEALRQL